AFVRAKGIANGDGPKTKVACSEALHRSLQNARVVRSIEVEGLELRQQGKLQITSTGVERVQTFDGQITKIGNEAGRVEESQKLTKSCLAFHQQVTRNSAFKCAKEKLDRTQSGSPFLDQLQQVANQARQVQLVTDHFQMSERVKVRYQPSKSF